MKTIEQSAIHRKDDRFELSSRALRLLRREKWHRRRLMNWSMICGSMIWLFIYRHGAAD